MSIHSPAAPLLLVLAALLWIPGCTEESRVTTGSPAPPFSLERLEGGRSDFPADYRGTITAVRFWADWCPFCKDEMNAIEPVYRRYQRDGLRILAVNVRQDRPTAAAFIERLKISYEVLLDSEGTVARAYGVSGLPTTVFVDRNGVVQGRIVGESTPEVFEQVVKPLLER